MVFKLAFVGCGKIALTHLKALKSLKDAPAVITTLVDIDLKVAEEFNKLLDTPCKIFQTLQEAIAHGDFDSALLMLPHNLHLQFATECLQAGKHVLLEKPLTTTVPECVKLIEQAKVTDKVILVAENSVWWPEIVRAKELIKAGTIGDIYFIQGNYYEEIGKDYFGDAGVIPAWYKDAKQFGGGAVIGGGVHWARMFRILFGEIDKVIGMKMYPWKDYQGESLAHVMLQFKNGCRGVLHCHLNEIPMSEMPFFQIFGSKGEITISGFQGGITVRTKDSRAVITENLGGYFGAFVPQMSNFMSVLEKGERVNPEDTNSVWEGSKDVAVVSTIYKSMETQSWESVKFDF